MLSRYSKYHKIPLKGKLIPSKVLVSIHRNDVNFSVPWRSTFPSLIEKDTILRWLLLINRTHLTTSKRLARFMMVRRN